MHHNVIVCAIGTMRGQACNRVAILPTCENYHSTTFLPWCPVMWPYIPGLPFRFTWPPNKAGSLGMRLCPMRPLTTHCFTLSKTHANNWLERKRCTKKEFLLIAGQLQHVAMVIRPGRAFLRCLFELSTVVRSPKHHIKLNWAAWPDLAPPPVSPEKNQFLRREPQLSPNCVDQHSQEHQHWRWALQLLLSHRDAHQSTDLQRLLQISPTFSDAPGQPTWVGWRPLNLASWGYWYHHFRL